MARSLNTLKKNEITFISDLVFSRFSGGSPAATQEARDISISPLDLARPGRLSYPSSHQVMACHGLKAFIHSTDSHAYTRARTYTNGRTHTNTLPQISGSFDA